MVGFSVCRRSSLYYLVQLNFKPECWLRTLRYFSSITSQSTRSDSLLGRALKYQKTNVAQKSVKLPISPLFAPVLKPNISRIQFQNFMDGLQGKENTSIIPTVVSQAVDRLLVQYQPWDTNLWINWLNGMGSVGFYVNHFSDHFVPSMMTAVESYLTEHPESTFQIMNELIIMQFMVTDFTPQLLDIVYKNLEQQLLDSKVSIDIEQTLRSLRLLKFSWLALPKCVQIAFQERLIETLPTFSLQDLVKVLTGIRTFKIKFEDFSIARNPLIQALDELSHSMDDDTAIKCFVELAQIHTPFGYLTSSLGVKMEEAFMASFESGDLFALHYVANMTGRNEIPREIKYFLTNHAPLSIIKLPAESFARQFKLLSDMKLKWVSFPTEVQDSLLSTLVTQLPQFSSSSSFFTLQGLIVMNPSFDSLPPVLQGEIYTYLIGRLQLMSGNGFCTTLSCMGKMKMKYSQLPDELKVVLHNSLWLRMTTVDSIGTNIIVCALADIGMTSNDFSEQLNSKIVMCLKRHHVILRSAPLHHISLLESSLQSIFQQSFAELIHDV